MVTASVAVFLHLVFLAVAGNVHLATENRFERLESFLGSFSVYAIAVVEELLDAEHIAMVGDGHTLHSVANSLVNES